jgi:histidine triad (HIT) family protein
LIALLILTLIFHMKKTHPAITCMNITAGRYAIAIALLICSFFTRSFSQSQAYTDKKTKQLAAPSPFQRELDGQLPKRVLYEDKLVMVLDGNPVVNQAPVHLLVIPKKRFPTVNETTDKEEALLGHMIQVAKDMAKQKGISETGYRLVINTNEDAGQSAFHIHLHLLGGTKTGPMVDQSWRNIQRAKRAGEDSTYLTVTTKDTFLMKLLGNWQANGTAFGRPAKINMVCEPILQFQYMKLSYSMDMQDKDGKSIANFEGTASYRPDGAGGYKATWFDSGGAMHPIKATVNDNILTSWWGTPQTQEGKTIYRLINNNAVEIIDSVKTKTGEWRQFNRNTLEKMN